MRSTVKRWLLAEYDEEMATKLANELGVDPIMARLLVRRGVSSVEAAKRFLYPQKSNFYDPFLLKDMRKTIDRIRSAVVQKEKVLVYGDYDADGATSTSFLYLGLREIGAQVDYYIPNRFSEGYGLNAAALQEAHANGYSLIITVDNGISAHQEAILARELGVDLIVTDHHTPPPELPEAYAIINPKQPGCTYPDKMLAGVGVVCKVVEALYGRLPEEMLDLAAIGTIADLAPLMDENRLFAHFGLDRINRSPRPGIRALIEVTGLEGKEITAGHVGFSFGPRINAAGRLDSATEAVELLITDDPERAKELADALELRNRERQQLSESITQEAIEEIESHPEWLQDRVLVVAGEGWNAGVIGIVASRLVERYYRPTLMISITEGIGKGSARSISGFHLYDAMFDCRDLFEHFGGHKMAAGFSLPVEDINELRERLNRYAMDTLREEDLTPKIEVDTSLRVEAATLDFVKEVARMAPFGFGNPSPRFLLQGLQIGTVRAVGQDKAHLQARLIQGEHQLPAIGFRMGAQAREFEQSGQVELVGDLSINEWKGTSTVQLIMEDWRAPKLQVQDLRNHSVKQKWLEQKAVECSLTVLCFQQENVERYTKIMTSYPWQEIRDSQICFVQEDGLFSEDQSQLYQDVVIGDLPTNLEVLETVIRSLPKESNVYLLYDRDSGASKSPFPDRGAFARVYRILQELRTATGAMIGRRVQEDEESVAFILAVFVELEFAKQDGNSYHVIEGTSKKSLTESALYQSQLQIYDDHKNILDQWCNAPTEQVVEKLSVWLSNSEEAHQV